MTVLPELEQALFDAAEERLGEPGRAQRRHEPGRARRRQAPRPRAHRPRLGAVAVVLSVMLTGFVAVLAVVLLGTHARPASRVSGHPVQPAAQQLYGKRTGGILTAYSATNVQHLDPGQAYDAPVDYAVLAATQRTLFAYLPGRPSEPVSDLATVVPTTANGGISDGGRTITVHIRPGVYFSPPVNREVTSADVAYAIERGANPNVANPYFATYFGSGAAAPLVGAQSPSYTGGPIPGIQTPNRFTIVFHTTRPSGSFLVQALTLPLSAPVPESFAGSLDAHHPTTYGATYLVATGPYMVQSNATGMIAGVGDRPAQPPTVPALGHLTLVRNPRWNPKTDFRPAYLDGIDLTLGGDPSVVGRQTLTGADTLELDPPAPSAIALALASHPAQIAVTPDAGERYAALDNRHGPFVNADLRRAVWAALNRQAIVQAEGGALFAQPMTHFIYPGVDGFVQSGGYAGPQLDFNRDLSGSLAVAARYMRLAGYPSGRYTGTALVRVLGTDAADGPVTTGIVNDALLALGFHTRVTLVRPDVMYAKYCGVPSQAVDVCADVGWTRDTGDAQTVLYQPFFGPAITSSGNANVGQVNEARVNGAITKATSSADAAGRALAWARVDGMLVDDAVAVPETFESQAALAGSAVNGVTDMWNTGTWDLDFTSLK